MPRYIVSAYAESDDPGSIAMIFHEFESLDAAVEDVKMIVAASLARRFEPLMGAEQLYRILEASGELPDIQNTELGVVKLSAYIERKIREVTGDPDWYPGRREERF